VVAAPKNRSAMYCDSEGLIGLAEARLQHGQGALRITTLRLRACDALIKA
jgi:hypothetical protein